MEKNDFSVNILDQNDEGLCGAMDLLIPSEIRDNRQVYAE